MNKIKFFLILIVSFYSSILFAQKPALKIGNNPATINSSAALEVESTNKGFLPPRLTNAQRAAITSPTSGLTIFNTDINCLEIYNGSTAKWTSLCGTEAGGTAEFTPDCGSLTVLGTYYSAISLTDTEYITINVDVTVVGTYNIIATASTMAFAATGTFTNTGTQQIILYGQGKPSIAGSILYPITIGETLCSALINVTNGIATVTTCHSAATLVYGYYHNAYQPWPAGRVLPDSTLTSSASDSNGTVVASITGITYTGTALAYGISSSTVNGMSLARPLQGVFSSASPAALELEIVGKPILVGNWNLPYKINSYGTTCNVTIPVRSGTAYITALNVTGTLAGSYIVDQYMDNTNTKTITATVGTLADGFGSGDCMYRTNTANGVYFEAYESYSTTGAKTVVLGAFGAPIETGTFSYTITVSNANTTFLTSSAFNVTFTQPTAFPVYPQCAAVGTTYSYIKASNTATGDNFGGYVNTDAVSPFNALLGGSNLQFGKSTKISGDGLTMVVGASAEDSGNAANQADNTALESGAVYIFSRASTANSFTQQAYLKASNIGAGDRFGQAVDISDDGNTIVVSAPEEDGPGEGPNDVNGSLNTKSNSGAVYVFKRTGSTWTQISYIKNVQNTAGDKFGMAVAISGSGTIIAVGTPLEDSSIVGAQNSYPFDEILADSGSVTTYTVSGSTVSLLNSNPIKAYNAGSLDYFGASVDLNYDGTVLVVGAPYEDGSGLGINPTNNNSLSNAGVVYVFNLAATFVHNTVLKPTNTGSGSDYGLNVSISDDGTKIAVGAPFEDRNVANTGALTDSGAVYYYQNPGTGWVAKQRIKTPTAGASDNFGFSVTLSGDGNYLIIGAPNEDGSIPTASCAAPTIINAIIKYK